MSTCPFFGKCGGCRFDFTSPDYQTQKRATLSGITPTGKPVWIKPGDRRRAEFCFGNGRFGFYATASKDIIPVKKCPGVRDGINAVLPGVATLPYDGTGGVLITLCDNGIDIAITSNVPYYSTEFKAATDRLPPAILRVTWNNNVVLQRDTPTVTFGTHTVPYPAGAFLQPGIDGANTLRDLVTSRASGYKRVADLFCGLGNFTFALNADGFDIVGTGVCRDLFRHPLLARALKQYDCIVMDPPRAGAMAQCRELAKNNVPRIIYVSCNPTTFVRDKKILEHGGYRVTELIPVDQFVGSAHWEIFAVFDKKTI